MRSDVKKIVKVLLEVKNCFLVHPLVYVVKERTNHSKLSIALKQRRVFWSGKAYGQRTRIRRKQRMGRKKDGE